MRAREADWLASASSCRISATSSSRSTCVEQREFSLGLMSARLKTVINQPPPVEICCQVHIDRTCAK
ncbi:hypothetical protein ZWY2020_011182 [Hordeum vulgare]|nr:hypothetical protein ZWY2020_011182 [Hordeum vulgare]